MLVQTVAPHLCVVAQERKKRADPFLLQTAGAIRFSCRAMV